MGKNGIKMNKFLNFDGEARIENNGLNLFSENVYTSFSKNFAYFRSKENGL